MGVDLLIGWSIAGSLELRAIGNENDDKPVSLQSGDLSWNDYRYTIRLIPSRPISPHGSAIGVVFRYTHFDNYYKFYIYRKVR
jgi:hypothetical protein